MEKIVINKLGPIKHCTLEINDFMVFTGPQASGKSTIAKSIFFFKNIKNLLLMQINKKLFGESDTIKLTIKNRLIKEVRANFLQTFGTTWCMDNDMFMEYYYTDSIYIKIWLKDDPISPNYIWIEFSEKLIDFLGRFDNIHLDILSYARNSIDEFFGNN